MTTCFFLLVITYQYRTLTSVSCMLTLKKCVITCSFFYKDAISVEECWWVILLTIGVSQRRARLMSPLSMGLGVRTGRYTYGVKGEKLFFYIQWGRLSIYWCNVVVACSTLPCRQWFQWHGVTIKTLLFQISLPSRSPFLHLPSKTQSVEFAISDGFAVGNWYIFSVD